MKQKELIQKIMKRKEYSKLPLQDVKLALSFFDKKDVIDEERVKLTRELLHKVYSSFTSQKLLTTKKWTRDWILNKHLSTRERMVYYEKLYKRIFDDYKKYSVVDLGAGVNGFSYEFYKNDVNYVGVEAVGQLVDLTNNYFGKKGFNGKAWHLSLFNPLCQSFFSFHALIFLNKFSEYLLNLVSLPFL